MFRAVVATLLLGSGAAVIPASGAAVIPASGDVGNVDPLAAPNTASWSTKCSYSKQTSPADPIREFGSPGTMMHSFFGADGVTRTTTPADLRARTSNFCAVSVNDPLHPRVMIPDNSAYWYPALYTTRAKRTGVNPFYLLSYYRNAFLDPQTIRPFPRDLAMVGGDSKATTRQVSNVAYVCIARSDQSRSRTTIPATCPIQNRDNPPVPYTLRATVAFPNCVRSDASLPNYTHRMTYAVANPAFPANSVWPLICPGRYSPIPQISIAARWPLTAFPVVNGRYDLTGATLSSDLMMMRDGTITGGHGTTLHADFMSGWTAPDIKSLVTNCFHRAQINCGAFGNGNP